MAPRKVKIPGIGTGEFSEKFGDNSVSGKLSADFIKSHPIDWDQNRRDSTSQRNRNRQRNYDNSRDIYHPENTPGAFGVDVPRYFANRDGT